MERIVECVPNFSEGRDRSVIDAIAQAIAPCGGSGSEEGYLKVLNVDSGAATNRTVITFAGSPEAVIEGAFRGVAKAAQLIDMRTQHGTHPRIGASDVVPIVPVKGISLEECARLSRNLARRIFTDLGIPVYCYEAAAFRPEFRNLAVCRQGEYESLLEKIQDPSRRPDFSPSIPFSEKEKEIIQRSGASVVGARNFLIAVNFNLDTTSVNGQGPATKDQARAIAKDIALDVREKGRGPGRPGKLERCKAIGWYIDEYGFAQVAMNITDFQTTSIFKAYEEVSKSAESHGVRVRGTEIIGLVPQKALGDVNDAIKTLHLDDIRPFNPKEKIIEYLL